MTWRLEEDRFVLFHIPPPPSTPSLHLPLRLQVFYSRAVCMTVLPDITPIPDDPIVKNILKKAVRALQQLSQGDGAADADVLLALDAVQAMIDLNQMAGRAYFGARRHSFTHTHTHTHTLFHPHTHTHTASPPRCEVL